MRGVQKEGWGFLSACACNTWRILQRDVSTPRVARGTNSRRLAKGWWEYSGTRLIGLQEVPSCHTHLSFLGSTPAPLAMLRAWSWGRHSHCDRLVGRGLNPGACSPRNLQQNAISACSEGCLPCKQINRNGVGWNWVGQDRTQRIYIVTNKYSIQKCIQEGAIRTLASEDIVYCNARTVRR